MQDNYSIISLVRMPEGNEYLPSLQDELSLSLLHRTVIAVAPLNVFIIISIFECIVKTDSKKIKKRGGRGSV